jgi:DNA-binding GntR family transcriptional regulator
VSVQASTEQYELLRRRLVVGDFPPGTLLQETGIAAENGVSRTPVRDALSRLEQDGFLRRAPRGYRVRERTPEEVVDVYTVRIALEAQAAELAAERRTIFDLRSLSETQTEAEQASDTQRLTELSSIFHEQVAVASHNIMLQDTLGRLHRLMAMYGSHAVKQPENQELNNQEHAALFKAIADHDADRARRVATAHLLRVRDTRIVAMLQSS